MKALANFRLGNFDKAIVFFRRAKKLGSKSRELSYFLGQSYYATQEYKKSIDWFKSSLAKNYLRTQSLYYLGQIHQSLSLYDQAIEYYKRIQKEKDDKANVKQLALFEMAQVSQIILKNELLSTSDVKPLKRFRYLFKPRVEQVTSDKFLNHVLPKYESAYDFNPNSDLSIQILSILNQLYRFYAPNEFVKIEVQNKMHKLSQKSWRGRISQKGHYDTNVTYEASDASIKAVNKKSYVYTTDIYFEKTIKVGNKWKLIPTTQYNFVKHSNDEDKDAFQNDAKSISLALKSKYQHEVNGRIANMNFNASYSHIKKDVNRIGNRTEYGKSYQATIGEDLYLFRNKTSLSFTYNTFDSYDNDFNYKLMNANITQSLGMLSHIKSNFSFFYRIIETDNDTFSNDTMGARWFAYVPSLFNPYIPQMDLSFAMVDTKKQKADRGTEKLINSKFKLGRAIASVRGFSIHGYYNLQKNISKNKQVYNFTKHIFGIEGVYDF